MEPTKLENQIQSELRNRIIEPSTAAWDRLDTMLTIAENKSNKKVVWWPVAASILGFFGIATVLFLQSEPLVDNAIHNSVVNTKTNKINEVLDKDTNLINKKSIDYVVLNSIMPSKVIKTKIQTTSKLPAVIEQDSKSHEEVIVDVKSQIVVVENKIVPATTQNKTVVPKYINPAVLLAEIESKITDKKTEIALQNQPIKTNAKSLLTEVDNELELSFRESALKKINKTYVAISQRNNLK